ncbi:MAG: MATE family efflux transporter [Bacteroidetes bacterium]|nr:MAG: MATE family efflux transporter [Bacteroidota bacterium]
MQDLTKGSVGKNILLFSLPLLAGTLFQQLYNVIDSIVVGNYIGKEALAAVGASFPVIFVAISLLIGVSSGISVVISQYYGAKQFDNVVKAINTFYAFVLVTSLFFSFLGVYFARDVFELLKLPAELLDDATLYLQIYLGGMVAMFGFFGTNAILRGMGDSKTPLYFTIVSTVLNIVLDLLFVLVFHWGIAGVAYASVISQAVSFIGAGIYLNRSSSLIKFSFKNLVVDFDILIKSLKIGLPTGLQQSFVALGMIAIMRIVNDFGTDTIAAFTAASRLDSFASMSAMAFASALATFVGQNLGANKIDRIKQGYKITLLFSSIMSILVSVLMYFFGRELIMLFSTDPNVIEIGYNYLVIVSSFYVLFSAMFVTQGLLRGAGDTLIPMFITLFALWLLRIPISYYLSRPEIGLGADGIWWGIPIAWTFGFSASLIYFLSGKWKKKGIIKH